MTSSISSWDPVFDGDGLSKGCTRIDADPKELFALDRDDLRERERDGIVVEAQGVGEV